MLTSTTNINTLNFGVFIARYLNTHQLTVNQPTNAKYLTAEKVRVDILQ
jgi:hypothetical protein